MNKSLADAVSAFGESTKQKLSGVAISGAPEDQLRNPIEILVRDLAEAGGLNAGAVHLVGETSLGDLRTRPDFAVAYANALVGFIEVKAPGKGADPRRFGDPHDKEQWNRLKSLPNLIYTDGNSFSLWRDGAIVGKVVHLDGDVESSGSKMQAPPTLLPLVTEPRRRGVARAAVRAVVRFCLRRRYRGRPGGRDGNLSAWRTPPYRIDGCGRPRTRCRAQRDRRGGETSNRIRAAVRPVRRGAAADHGRDAGADEDAAGGQASDPRSQAFITNTLGNPFVEEEWLPRVMESVAKSRRDANAIKRSQPITVVIGNPPYKEKAEGQGGWIESGSGGRHQAPLDRWKPPREWRLGAHAKHLKNLYVYFWRWATWKVFGSGLAASTDLPDRDEEGIICFITVAGFLNGPGFEKMRDDLRRTCSAVWVIDCSPEGHAPQVATRIFQGVKHRICITLAAKTLGKDTGEPARVRYRALAKGRRDEKFLALSKMSLDDAAWTDCPSGWRDPFLPAATGLWASFPALKDLFAYDGSGVMPGRTWIIAPDRASLSARWSRLTSERDATKMELLFHPHGGGDRTVSKPSKLGLAGHEHRPEAAKDDKETVIAPVRYGFRSFDRQWIIPDARLINRPNPTLWKAHSRVQVYLTGPEDVWPTNGAALTFTDLMPDLHHYHGRGGRVYPLWRDAGATVPNVKPALLAHLAEAFGRPVKAEDVIAYLAAAMAHPAFTARFQKDLVRPGLRVPLTADADLFAEAVALGREVVWLHCFGERFCDPAAGRPRQPPRLPQGEAPFIPADGAIPGPPEPLPDVIDYDAASRRLRIGKGFVRNVTPEMWAYEVSGMNVLRQWFSYRRRDRGRPIIGDRRPPSPLSGIQPDGWLAEYTTDLLDLLNVLGRLIALEPAQADLLDRICEGPLRGAAELDEAGALAMPGDGAA